MDDILNVLVCSSEYYAPMLGVMLTSLFENNKAEKEICVFVMTSDMLPQNRDKLQKLAEEYRRVIQFVDAGEIDNMLEEINAPRYNGSYAGYYELFALPVLSMSVDRLLYLEADMLVVDSLSALYRCELKEDEMLAMTQSVMTPSRFAKQLKLDDGCYYTAAPILFDVKKWRNENASEKVAHHLKNVHASYPLPNEVLINILFSQHIKKLPMCYGVFSSNLIWKDWRLQRVMYGLEKCYEKEEFEQALINPVVIHYGAPPLNVRPWLINKDVPDMYWAGCDQWREYWKKSLWSDCPLMEYKLSFRSKGIVFCQRHLPSILFACLYGYLVEKNAMATLKQHGL